MRGFKRERQDHSRNNRDGKRHEGEPNEERQAKAHDPKSRFPFGREARFIRGARSQRLSEQGDVRRFDAENRCGRLPERRVFEIRDHREIRACGFAFDDHREGQNVVRRLEWRIRDRGCFRRGRVA